jgi:uncharacterized cupredoxin-like copper-binding protein
VRARLLVPLLLVPLTVAVGAMARASTTSSATVTAVNVELREWKITPSTTHARAGTVTFVARNKGRLEHELVVIRSNRPASGLPLEGGGANEAGSRGEIDGVPPGKTAHLTLDLRPGRYVLICNRSDHRGHYVHGMFAAFTVS